MKTAIYIEDGIQQIVLTPENDFEKNIIDSLSKEPNELKVHQGSFYDCRGGWVRQSYYNPNSIYGGVSDDNSMIITKRKNQTENP